MAQRSQQPGRAGGRRGRRLGAPPVGHVHVSFPPAWPRPLHDCWCSSASSKGYIPPHRRPPPSSTHRISFTTSACSSGPSAAMSATCGTAGGRLVAGRPAGEGGNHEGRRQARTIIWGRPWLRKTRVHAAVAAPACRNKPQRFTSPTTYLERIQLAVVAAAGGKHNRIAALAQLPLYLCEHKGADQGRGSAQSVRWYARHNPQLPCRGLNCEEAGVGADAGALPCCRWEQPSGPRHSGCSPKWRSSSSSVWLPSQRRADLRGRSFLNMGRRQGGGGGLVAAAAGRQQGVDAGSRDASLTRLVRQHSGQAALRECTRRGTTPEMVSGRREWPSSALEHRKHGTTARR